MIISRSFICLCLIIWSIATFAQSIDTVYHDDPVFPYSLVENDGKGRPHGMAHVYDTSGVVRRTYHNLNGIWHGPDTVFDENGRVRRVAMVENGFLNGTFLIYYPDGKLEATREYKKGKPHGSSTYYYANGQVSMTAPYKNGQVHGTSHLYYQNGNIEWTKGYRNGKLHGERIAWDSTGVLLEGQHTFQIAPYSEATFTVICNNGRPEGDFKVIYPDGKVSFTGKYVNGLPDGEWIYYERTGLVDRVEVYKKGKFKETRRSYN